MQTIKYLAQAYVGESQAMKRYFRYAKVAKKEGYEQISEIFTITAANEQEHASWFLKMLKTLTNDNLTVDTDVIVELGTTADNLQTSINGEAHEHEELYPEFAKVAREEGQEEIANRIDAIILSEKHHKERFQKLLDVLKSNSLQDKEEETTWFCRKCGYEMKGKSAPDECPSCSHPKGYFQIQNEKY